MTTKIKSGVIGDNVVGITQLNVSDGTNGQYLQTDGAGTLSFSTVSGTTINNNADNRIITGSGTANTLNAESTLTFANSDLYLNATSPSITIESASTQDSKILFIEDGVSAVSIFYEGSAGSGQANNLNIRRELSGSEANLVTFGLDGNVGIGATNPNISGFSKALTIDSSESGIELSSSGTIQAMFAANTQGATIHGVGSSGIRMFTSASGSTTERMRIDSSGRVGINTSSPDSTATLHIKSNSEGTSGDAVVIIEADQDNNDENDNPRLEFWQDGRAVKMRMGYDNNDFQMVNEYAAKLQFGTANAIRMTIEAGGSVSVAGAFSKGSGSFKIDHPLPAKTDTHHLIHSFVEAPQADNIYRGKVDLAAGSATVNIDTVAGMTEGTFVALNREVQCFTTNESNWDAIKGSVSGNILTIESQNSESTATISWLVIGERQDQHMYDTDWTDENGKVIVEPLKEIETLENA
jgi:hypothetical protein